MVRSADRPGGLAAGPDPLAQAEGSGPGAPDAPAAQEGAGAVAPPRRGHPLARYVGFRLAASVLMLFGVTLVTFTLANIVPGDPAAAALGERAAADPVAVAQYRRATGMDQPLPQQYLNYLQRLSRGDLGTSIQTRVPIREEMGRAFPATVELAIASVLVSVIVATALGMWAALRRGRGTDHLIRTLSLVGLSVPVFWMAMLGYYLLFYQLRLVPGSGRLAPTLTAPPHRTGLLTVDALLAGQWTTLLNAVQHLILPAAVLGLYTVGLLTRFIRSAVLEVLAQEYVLAARAKGLPPRRVLFGYVLRGASVPIITVIGLAFGSLLSGTVLVEKIFSWHGLGEYAFNASTHLDLPAIMAVGLIVGSVYIGINLVVDLVYGLVDPRVRVAA